MILYPAAHHLSRIHSLVTVNMVMDIHPVCQPGTAIIMVVLGSVTHDFRTRSTWTVTATVTQQRYCHGIVTHPPYTTAVFLDAMTAGSLQCNGDVCCLYIHVYIWDVS